MDYILYITGSILIIPAIIFALVAQVKVMGAFDHYKTVPSTKGMTAAEVARRMLRDNGVSGVEVIQTGGHLTDHYDPKRRVVALSDEVYGSSSLAAIGIAAHEVGHAIQHHTKYAPLILRQLVIKSTSLVNKLLMPLIIIGIFGSFFFIGGTILGLEADLFWFIFILAFCVLYGISFAVNLITLPTEYNASRRAKKLLRTGGYLFDDEEYHAVSKVLGAAALTYLASLLVSLAYFLRFLGLLLSMTRRD